MPLSKSVFKRYGALWYRLFRGVEGRMDLCQIDLTNLKAKEIMQSEVLTAPPEAQVCQLINQLICSDKEEVVVLDQDQHVTGIITRKALLRKINEGLDLRAPVREVMQQPVIAVKGNDDVYQVREIMREHKIGRVPVVSDSGRLIGLVTAVAICNGFSDKLEEVGGHLQAVLDSITEAAFVFNKYCRLIYWNNSARRLCKNSIKPGVRSNEIASQELIKNVLATGKAIKNIYEVREGRHLVKNISPIIKLGEVIGAVCTVEDVTKVVNLMNKVESRNEKAELIQGLGKGEKRGNQVAPEPPCFEAFSGRGKRFEKLIALAKKAARVDATVLIRGETGTGKELMARSLHLAGPRKNKPFVVVDCSAIPETLFESELFGYEPGAFTGASRTGKKGKLEIADGGTLFLDEIGELPLEMQAKLLRVIQEREFYRVGGVKPVRVDLRFIAATNRDLEQMVKEGNFREDLFYRLNVVTLELPSLRERGEELPGLVKEFIEQFSKFYDIPISSIEEGVISALRNYSWPGNYRELRNVAERLVLLSENGCIKIEHLSDVIREDLIKDCGEKESGPPDSGPEGVYCLEEMLAAKEREAILSVLKQHQYNKSRAARALNIPRSTLYYKIKSLNINV